MPRSLPALSLPVLALAAAPVGAATYGEGVWPELPALPPTGAGTRDAALVVGVERYARYPDLRGAAAGAGQWARWLADTHGLPAERVRLLTDDDATCARVREAATDLAERVPDGGALWVVFVGRGALRAEEGSALLLCANADPGAAEVRGRGLDLTALMEILGQGRQRRSLLVLDTAFVPVESFPPGSGAAPAVLQPGPAFVARGDTTALLASNAMRGLPGLPELHQPAFSYLLLGALRGWGDTDRNGHVTVAEAMEYVRSVLHAVEPGAADLPAAWGPADGVVVSEAREFAPDLAELLGRAAEHRLQRRVHDLGESERLLRAEATAVWQAVLGAYGLGGADALASVQAFLDRWQTASVRVDRLERWVRVPELDDALALLAVARVRPVTEEPPRTMAQERHFQLVEEVRQFTRRGAWKGVEATYLEMLALAEQGVVLSAQDHLSGAEAARQLGVAAAVRERLLLSIAAGSTGQAVDWLNELEQSYHRVRLVSERREPIALEPVVPPFAPDRRAAVVAAQEAIQDRGAFEGLLPVGVYRFGGELVAVVPGDPPVDLVLERGRRGAR